ncbi:hypothetical protein D5F01_LYC04411 [Larimichthys crocea]|uniref:Envelope glycoprotein n=1 Tax=Larimichthys crocea TaxID=215358 RepID=A0A6G0J247_LARCR|nr:hypothetical protein D5F01_LYC04411 [Larimichthys crocea]
MAVMAGLVAVLAILYHYGSHPWALTHTRVQHGTTKTVQQACWTVESRTILMEWDKNQTWLNLTTRRQEGEWVNWLAALNGTEIKLNTAKNGNATNGTEVLQAPQQIGDRELMLQVLKLQGKETKTVRCTWIQAGSEEPGWYCTWGCRPLAGLEGQGYWEEEVIFPAPPRNDTCPAALPKWTFWGNLNLTCDLTSSRVPKNRRPKEKGINQDSTTEGTGCNDAQAPATSTPDESPEQENASSTGTTPPPGTAAPVKAPMQESTLKLIDPGFEPKEGPYPQWIKNVTRDCVYQQKGHTGTIPNAYHEDWLNNTLPWIWVTPLQHFVGAFPEGQRWTGLGLKGPYKTDMYVQKVPRPNDLTSVPSGDFQKVDLCVAEKIFQDLNNTVFVSDGKSPRCPLNQVRTTVWAHWIYDCSGLKTNKTIKGVLQAWKEGYQRDSTSTWWGLEQDEVRRWVVPCLVNTSNYWLKYQYIATVYSKDRDIWPGMWSKPVPVVSPRPWAMSCDHANSTCTVSLARRHCQHVPGWEMHCLQHYKDEYDTHGSQVVWKKIKDEWIRAYPPGVGCAKVILGHGMSRRKEVLGKTVPFVADPTIIIAEGHAFRKSLCEGKETTGYEWLGPNRIYNNGTCHSPAEHWMHCGSGKEKHECTWIERAGMAVKGVATAAIEEATEIIEEGVGVIKGWITNLLAQLWPYLLMLVGLVIAGAIVAALVKGGAKAITCPRRKSAKKEEGKKPLLWKGEEQDSV